MKTILSLLITAAFALSVSAQDSTIKTMEVRSFAGAPVASVSEIDTLTIATSTSAGTFTIAIAGGRTTQAITWSATNATLLANVNAALVALPQIGAGGVTVAAGTLTAGIGTITITMAGKNLSTDFPLLSIGTNALTGGSAPTLTTTTPGVAGTWRSAPIGQLLVDSSTPGLYQNTSTTLNSPTWTQITVP